MNKKTQNDTVTRDECQRTRHNLKNEIFGYVMNIETSLTQNMNKLETKIDKLFEAIADVAKSDVKQAEQIKSLFKVVKDHMDKEEKDRDELKTILNQKVDTKWFMWIVGGFVAALIAIIPSVIQILSILNSLNFQVVN